MKYNYLVKHNGEYYPAGTEVPVEEVKEPVKKEDIRKTPIEEVKEKPSKKR